MVDDWLNHHMVCYIERDIFTIIEHGKVLRHYRDPRNNLIVIVVYALSLLAVSSI